MDLGGGEAALASRPWLSEIAEFLPGEPSLAWVANSTSISIYGALPCIEYTLEDVIRLVPSKAKNSAERSRGTCPSIVPSSRRISTAVLS